MELLAPDLGLGHSHLFSIVHKLWGSKLASWRILYFSLALSLPSSFTPSVPPSLHLSLYLSLSSSISLFLSSSVTLPKSISS